ncbi:hypothetical protein [Piscinibacter sp. XHJ-5]|uniref:hypothetical protein n=1 Tax=Piscinibacter sp. XHJ-5 TaxID=3037797 RepID=UPI0024533CCF|nr:hypothetical protein [Piscinibacter sp. XHJ-5]
MFIAEYEWANARRRSVSRIRKAAMLSISWISLPPETLQRMASHDPAASPCGRRWERAVALATAALACVLVVGAIAVVAI